MVGEGGSNVTSVVDMDTLPRIVGMKRMINATDV